MITGKVYVIKSYWMTLNSPHIRYLTGTCHMKKYRKYSIKRYSEKTFARRFGTWSNALLKAGLRNTRGSKDVIRIEDSEMVNDIKRVANMHNTGTVTSVQYKEFGKYALLTITDRYGCWADALAAAGLNETGFIGKYSDDELYAEIERVWTSLGRQPTTTDMRKTGTSKISLDTYLRRFGGWRGALQSFIQFIKSPQIENPMGSDVAEDKHERLETVDNPIIQIKKTSRSINLRMRFIVLSRDGFSCSACGSSPAKDRGVDLHVDHIIPWSKGGETVLDNLRTLCSKCNLGKSNNDG